MNPQTLPACQGMLILLLFVTLVTEGLREKDKTSFGSVLKAVTQFNHRDNSLSLGRHVHKELRVDWPFYTEEERDRLRKYVGCYYST